MFVFVICHAQVGFFPSECVEVIGDKVPQSMASRIPDPPHKAGECGAKACLYPEVPGTAVVSPSVSMSELVINLADK